MFKCISVKMLVILAAILIISCSPINKETQVCFREHCYDVEVANTPEERAEGLMYRTEMPTKLGMLFIFDNLASHNFWMKNTLIPLDIIWLDENKKVVGINHDTQPCEEETCPSYGPEESSLYVLELNSGEAEKIGLKEEDKLELLID